MRALFPITIDDEQEFKRKPLDSGIIGHKLTRLLQAGALGPNPYVFRCGATGKSLWVDFEPDFQSYLTVRNTTMFTVQLDDKEAYVATSLSLAAVTNEVRGKAKRVRIWAESGLLLVDTKLDDNSYHLITKEDNDANS